MEYTGLSGTAVCDASFSDEIRTVSGVKFDRCYQCLTCTLGCPLRFAMDVPPNEIVRLTQLGMKGTVLGSSTIWVCASCETCLTRCPNDIDIPHLMDVLHQIAEREGVLAKGSTVPAFHRAFLSPIKLFGRQFEALMNGLYMLRARKFSLRDLIFSAALGLNLMKRGKLKITPSSVKGKKEVKRIFEKTAKEGKK